MERKMSNGIRRVNQEANAGQARDKTDRDRGGN